MVANKVVFVIMLTAAFASLALRWRSESQPLLRAIFTCSYPVYFAAALIMGVMINADWTMFATGLGVLLFLLSSYIERQPYMQMVCVMYVWWLGGAVLCRDWSARCLQTIIASADHGIVRTGDAIFDHIWGKLCALWRDVNDVYYPGRMGRIVAGATLVVP